VSSEREDSRETSCLLTQDVEIGARIRRMEYEREGVCASRDGYVEFSSKDRASEGN